LPNTTAHNETCANIGNVLWNWRMFLATGEARFMDVAELALYNSVLSGVSLDGTNFFYVNPLRTTDPLPTELRWQHQRVPYVSSFCCPPNLVRTIASSAQFAYAKSAETIWMNLYGASELETHVPGVGKVKLVQETEYPWNGRVRIKIISAPEQQFALKLRIPSWAKDAKVRINHGPVRTCTGSHEISPSPLNGERAGVRGEDRQSSSNSERTATPTSHPSPLIPLPVEGRGKSHRSSQGDLAVTDGYIELRRAWKSGDIVDLDLQMDTELIEANPLVEETLGQITIKRGPIVYCLESPDLPAGVRVQQVTISRTNQFLARYDHRLLGGVAVLDTTLQAKVTPEWGNQLYRELLPASFRPVKTKLIPYSVWANRGKSEMTVWLPLTDR
jgi:hypothetical protein